MELAIIVASRMFRAEKFQISTSRHCPCAEADKNTSGGNLRAVEGFEMGADYFWETLRQRLELDDYMF
jgi:hypothetical protein